MASRRGINTFCPTSKQQIPIATTMGGGYGETAEEVADRHLIIFKVAESIFRE